MVAIRDRHQHVSPMLIVGAASISIVVGVSALRYASAEEPPTAQSQTMKTEVKAESSVSDDGLQQNVSAESSTVRSGVDETSPQQTRPTAQGSVTVNGQTYTVPQTGELHTTTSDANGNTSVDISVQSSGSGQNYNSSSSNVHVYSNSFNVSQSTGGASP